MDQLHAVQGNKRKFYLRCSLLNTYAYLAIVVIKEHSFQHASIWPIIYTKMAWTTNVKKKKKIFFVGKLGKGCTQNTSGLRSIASQFWTKLKQPSKMTSS